MVISTLVICGQALQANEKFVPESERKSVLMTARTTGYNKYAAMWDKDILLHPEHSILNQLSEYFFGKSLEQLEFEQLSAKRHRQKSQSKFGSSVHRLGANISQDLNNDTGFTWVGTIYMG